MTWSSASLPEETGVYFDWEAAPTATPPVNIGAVVAIPATHDWGPVAVATLVQSLGDFQQKFGDSTTTDAYRAVKMAFTGIGGGSEGGAGAVLFYRLAATPVTATRQFNNTAGSPVPGIRLDARYPGTRGNNLRITIQDKAGDSTKDQLIVFDGSTQVELYEYLDTNVADLAAQITANARSRVVATSLVTGVALAPVASAALTTGADGTTLTGTQWTAWQNALDGEQFSIVAPYNLADSGITTAMLAWNFARNAASRRSMLLLGGAAAEAVTTAGPAATAINDYNVMRFGMGTWADPEFGNLSTAQLVPRFAGALAARGETKDLTGAPLYGLTPVVLPTLSDTSSGWKAGVSVLGRHIDPDAEVRIQRAVTTYVTTSNTHVPYTVFSEPKFVRTMQLIELEFDEWSQINVIAKGLPNSESTRDYVKGEAREKLRQRETAFVIRPTTSIVIDNPDLPPDDSQNYIAFLFGAAFGRSVRRVFWQGQVS